MIVTRDNVEYKLEGDLVSVGDVISNFEVYDLDNNKVSFNDLKGEGLLISVFPDINTRVCAAQTYHFFKEASKYENVKIVNVSNNTPEQLNDWCAVNGVEALMLSDTDLSFAKAFGIYMPDFGVLARSVYVVNKDGEIVYMEIVPEMAQEPDYEKVFEAVSNL